jgi:dTDP-L-rhamnose 4-epimerase
MDLDIEPEITGKYRVGDIRHCFADIGRARALIGFAPQVSLQQGLQELVDWLPTAAAVDQADAAIGELERHGLALYAPSVDKFRSRSRYA